MTTKDTPLLTVHLFVSRENSWDDLRNLIRLNENGITVKQYKPDDSL